MGGITALGSHLQATVWAALFASLTVTALFAFSLVTFGGSPVSPDQWPYALGNFALFSIYALFFSFLTYAVGIFCLGFFARALLARLGGANAWVATSAGAALAAAATAAVAGGLGAPPDTNDTATMVGIAISGAVGGFAYYRASMPTIRPSGQAPR